MPEEDAELDEVVSGLLVLSPDILDKIRDNTYSEEFMGKVKDALAERMGGEDAEVAKQAAIALGLIGDARATPSLMEMLNSEDRGEFREAASALAAIGEQGAVHALISVLESGRRGFMYEAARALGSFGNAEAVEPLLEALDRSGANPALRAAAAMSLGRICGSAEGLDENVYNDVFDALSEAARYDNSMDVRRGAVTALGYMGDPECLGMLLDLASNDGDQGVRSRSIVSASRLVFANGGFAGEVSEMHMRDSYRPVLEREMLENERAPVRASAAFMLGFIDSEYSVSQLATVLRNGEEALSVRGAAANSLARLGNRDCIEALLDMAVSDDAVSQAASAALGDVTASAFHPLFHIFFDEAGNNEDNRDWAKVVLLAIPFATAMEQYLGEYGSVEVTWNAMELYPTPQWNVTDSLIGLLDDESAEVRRSAAILLERIPLLISNAHAAAALEALDAHLETETDAGVTEALQASSDRLSERLSGTRVARR